MYVFSLFYFALLITLDALWAEHPVSQNHGAGQGMSINGHAGLMAQHNNYEHNITTLGSEFVGKYHDSKHPGCERIIGEFSETEVVVTGFDGAEGDACNGKNDKPWGPLHGKVTDDSIVIDFSPKGGPSDLTGSWDTEL